MKVAELETAVDQEEGTVILRVAEGRKKHEITLSREQAIVLKHNLELAVDALDEVNDG